MTPKRPYSPEDMVNRPPIPKNWERSLVSGEAAVVGEICRIAARTARSRRSGACRIAIDGHLGVDWDRFVARLGKAMEEEGLEPIFFAVAGCLKNSRALEKMIRPCLPADPVFGRVFGGTLLHLFSEKSLLRLKRKLLSLSAKATERSRTRVLLCYGPGSALGKLRSLYDHVLYVDLCREEIFKRVKSGLAKPLGGDRAPAPKPSKRSRRKSADALPAYFGARRLYYVDYPVLDRHRRKLLPHVDYYIDGNSLDEPKMLPGRVLRAVLKLLTKGPVKPKPYYDPSPWGGQWLKKVRRLPGEMTNCAWSYDLIEPETSFLVAMGKSRIEVPFSLLAGAEPNRLMGSKGTRKIFRGQFPIRICYDDGFQGGDMALQCHPNGAYIQKHFNEPFRQDESYYILDCAAGSRVYLGLREEADVEEFRKRVHRAEKQSIPFDHNRFVSNLPTRPGDLFLIPAGTLHGSGVGNVVLEISATTYRYTLHFYDYLRPGLDGDLRSIHSMHAFNCLKSYRRARWVAANLKQEPRLLRKGHGWAEYLLGERKDMFFKVHRLEFGRPVSDHTRGEFHLLVVAAGDGVVIRPRRSSQLATRLPFSCVAALPAAVGPYSLEPLGRETCKVVKVLLS